MTINLHKRKMFCIIVFLAAGTAAAIATSYYLYFNYFENYAQLTVSQLDARLLPSTIKFTKISDEQLGGNPVLKDTLKKVSEKYRNLVSECPANRPVYCDISSNTRVTTGITSGQFESIMQSFNFIQDPDTNNNVWQSYVKQDCFYAIFNQGTSELNELQECYYRITLER